MGEHGATSGLEKVFTISDWYDGPRAGAAEYEGKPYWYRSVYLDSEEWNPDEDRFELTPLTPEVLAWELEQTEMFNRWDAARKDGTVIWNEDESTFGAFPDELPRYRELSTNIDAYLSRTVPELLVRGTFISGSETVKWELVID